MNVDVLTSGAFSGALDRLIPTYEKMSGNTVATTLAASTGKSPNTIPRRLAHGESADVVIMVAAELHALQARGLIARDTIVDLAKTSLALGVQRDAPQPDISSAETVKNALDGSETIAVSESYSGIYVRTELLAKLGIQEQVLPRVHTVTDELPGYHVARGSAQIVVEQLSELVAVDGIDVVGVLPESLQRHTTVAAALGARRAPRRAARELIAFLASPKQHNTLRAAGLTPLSWGL